MGEYKPLPCGELPKKYKNYDTLKFFLTELHMQLETADRRAKRTKIWDSGYYNAHIFEVHF